MRTAEFVGGPLDGELRVIDGERAFDLFAVDRPKLTDDQKAAINYREGHYEWRTFRKTGERVLVWQGWED
jgi:hypothetical protein